MTTAESYINRCINLAKKGLKTVAPNPMVGCVIVNKGKIIAESYHAKYGESHAEVNAINQVSNQELLKTATLYVSLEPCAHFGKTPPCSNLIIEKGIPNVVIACVDPYAEVAGKGIEKLEKAGINVIVGVLEEKALKLNKRFFTFHEKKRPYIVLKWAQTQDGFIDIERLAKTPNINWITQPQTKQLTDTWRTEEMAILVGKNTIVNDNPKLTVRTILGRNPIRIVIDKNNELDKKASVFLNDAETLVFNAIEEGKTEQTKYIKIPFKNTLEEIVEYLYVNEIQSILVEGGAKTLQHFIDANFWDEARVYTGTSFFHTGLKAPTLNSNQYNSAFFGKDKITIFHND